MKTYKAKRNIGDHCNAEYRVKANNQKEAEQKIFEMTGERLKVSEV